ncbi:hypothetical protein PZA11_002480 [Diplocarpon coronariae]
MALLRGWLLDGPCKGARWPFIYIGAVSTLGFSVALREMPLYENIYQRKMVYWLSQIGNDTVPLILSWISEICSDDAEKRALLVAAGNDFANVVQAVAPNFVWRTAYFPVARKGYLWSIVLSILLILWTAFIQILLTRGKKKAAKAIAEESATNSLITEFPSLTGSDSDEKGVVRTAVTLSWRS